MGYSARKTARILLFVSTAILFFLSALLLIFPELLKGTIAVAVLFPIILLSLISLILGIHFSTFSHDEPYRLITPRSINGNDDEEYTGTQPTIESQTGGWHRPRIDSSALLKTAADQKQTIERLQTEIKELEKKLSGSRMHEGIEDSQGTLILWNEKPFRRMVEAELWRSRRSQRPMTLIFMNFMDARPQRASNENVSGSSMWEYYSEAVCRAVRRGDHVGLGPRESVCALLPETTTDGARIAEKRIRDIVDREHERRKRSMDVDLVMDVAAVSFPNHGKTPDELYSAGKKGLLKAQRDRELP